MIIGWTIVAIIGLILAVVLIRTFSIKKSETPIDNYPILDKKTEEELFCEFSKVLKIATVDGCENCEALFAEYENTLKDMFPLFYTKAESIAIDGAFLYKFAGTKNTEKPSIILAHCDVVEANGTWEHEAFEPQLEDHKIFARGTVDNKGMAFAFHKAVEKFFAEGGSFNNDVYFMSTKNEESSSQGAKNVAKYCRENDLQFAVIFDEGGATTCEVLPGINNDIALLGLCEKGYYDVKFSAKSKGGHSGSPQSSNPFHRLSKFVCAVEKRGYFKVSMMQTLTEMFKAVAPYMGFELRLLLGNMWLFKPLVKAVLPAFSPAIGAMMKTTMVFTRAEGSGANNVIPETATMTANIRNLPTESAEAVLAKLKKTAEKYDITMEVLYEKPASAMTNVNQKEVQIISDTIKTVMPSTIVTSYVTIGATDCCLLDEFSDAVVRFSPIRQSGNQIDAMHGIDENVGVSELNKAIEFFSTYIKTR
ncbi:MAG: M20/M25/M40 family metallo-hydrolase [Bacillota bacterium]